MILGTISANAAKWKTTSIFLKYFSIVDIFEISFFINFMWDKKGLIFSILPVLKLSITTILCFFAINFSTKWLPIKPAPPVTNILLLTLIPLIKKYILSEMFIEIVFYKR